MNNDGLTLNQLAERNAALVTELVKLRTERDQLAAENVALKAFGDKLNEMYDDLNGEGEGWQGRAEVVCQQEALGAAMEEFDAIKTPATDRIVAGIKAEGAEACVRALVTLDDDDFSDAPNICAMVAYQLRKGEKS